MVVWWAGWLEYRRVVVMVAWTVAWKAVSWANKWVDLKDELLVAS